ncbi:MAG TPA: elongation factor G [Planctomycetaceae bacterium]|nr:elongation factor G [Planctomycetaceae bacterium]
MSRAIERIRNIGIVAHIDAGKTTTTERILFYAGETHRMGDVDDGTTVTDFDPEEAKRGITIYSAAVSCRWKDTNINIIDTPGHVDFTAEVERSLRVLDGAVVIFSAVEGVEAQSETVWRQADRYHVPRLCFINKLDRIGASFERTLEQIHSRLRAQPVPLQIPIGAGPADRPGGFQGIIDLVDMQAMYFGRDDQGQTIDRREIPEDYRDAADEWRMKLLDSVALLDDEAFAAYDATGDIPSPLLHQAIRKGAVGYHIQPLFCGASLSYQGVQPVLDGVVQYLPSPLDVPPVTGTNPNPKKPGEEVRKASNDEPVASLVFKVQASQHAELYFVRIYSGILKSRSRLLNPRTGEKELISQLWKIQANSKVQLEQAEAGDIVGIVGPKDSVTGDTLCDQHHAILLESITFPETVISMAVEPDSSAERKKLEETLKVLGKQDPTFIAKMSEETGQTIISGMGELHLEIIRNRMERDFGLKIRVHKPRVTYRETVQNAVDTEGTFERQVGGANQFAVVKIRLEPFAGETPITLKNAIKPGTLAPELEKTLLQSLEERMKGGGGTVGYPLMQVKITLLDVQQRQGETTDLSIRAAAAAAMENALDNAGPVLLEPIMKLEVVTPEDFLGNISGDLNARRAIIVNTEVRGNLIVLHAEAPLSQMFGYSTQVRSLSQGRASYSMEPLRYDPAPPDVLREMLGQ